MNLRTIAHKFSFLLIGLKGLRLGRGRVRLAASFAALVFLTSSCASSNQLPVGFKAEPRQNAADQDAESSAEPEMTEAEIGAQIDREIQASFRPYTEPDAVNYFNGIVKKLAEHAQRKDLPYQITLLYRDEIYATSAPGGRIYMTTGFIYFLENEAQAAAVIAHEIGQLQFRDHRLKKGRSYVDQVLQGGTAIAPAFGQIGMLAAVGLAMLKTAADHRSSKGEQTASDSNEKLIKADDFALHYLSGAGYDPQGMIDLMYKFLESKNDVLPYFKDYYEARPISQERMLAMQKSFSELPMGDAVYDVNRSHYLEMTKGIREIYQQKT